MATHHQYRCRLSDPSQPHNLSELRDGDPPSGCFTCRRRDSFNSSKHYYCNVCDLYFHDDLCYAFPMKMRHPYHPQHPLSFTFVGKSETLMSECNILDYYYDPTMHGHGGSTVQGKCDWCGEDIAELFYRCSVCGFSLDWECCRHDPPLTLANPSSHEHDLTLLLRPLMSPCDACGLVNARDPPYACHPCHYVVHLSCIYLPRVIKISYHPHRLSLTTHLPRGERSCGACYRSIDLKYGAYSCKEGCSSFFHPKCATHPFIWAGKELEWEPEEPEETEEPFEVIGEKEILHFSHEHHLWLNEEDNVCNANKQCQACTLPIDFDDFYGCMQCEFFLHVKCASLPRKTEHVLHHHPLILHPLPLSDSHDMNCSACKRISHGFTYRCEECDDYKLDVRCASVPSPMDHRSHQHPLYFLHDSQRETSCKGCGEPCSKNILGCILGCDFVLCFRCATFPHEAHYKHDEHLLTLCYSEDSSSGKYWCEACERELNPEDWFYTCDHCSVTLHLRCVFGISMYVMCGRSLDSDGLELKIAHNSSSTRPVCHKCCLRCRDRVFYEVMDRCFCSLECWKKEKEENARAYFPHRPSYKVQMLPYLLPPPPIYRRIMWNP